MRPASRASRAARRSSRVITPAYFSFSYRGLSLSNAASFVFPVLHRVAFMFRPLYRLLPWRRGSLSLYGSPLERKPTSEKAPYLDAILDVMMPREGKRIGEGCPIRDPGKTWVGERQHPRGGGRRASASVNEATRNRARARRRRRRTRLSGAMRVAVWPR